MPLCAPDADECVDVSCMDHVNMYFQMDKHTYVSQVCMHACMQMCMYVCMNVFVFVYMYVCANKHCSIWMWAMQYAYVEDVHEIWSVVDCT